MDNSKLQENSGSKKKGDETNVIWLIGAMMAVVMMWLINGFIYPLFVTGLNDRALNGDAFGAVNSLFSGLAFAGLIYTILMQKKELQLQREALSRQHEEMQESRGEQELQNRIQTVQVESLIRQMTIAGLEARIQALKLNGHKADSPKVAADAVIKIVELSDQILEQSRKAADSAKDLIRKSSL
ncbi:hypothetical protein P2G88_01865 [Aliiglaciecola sp. CAU 1673]|uniref:hypothetical protein n=1 Tax=Aliiglaciecola sp. CAU 1673 TaxID=3032595 RepID=UPI0023D9C6B2|nr:hypothetical protein [Aliiglaciecola sp. CAU 1673]MDF2176999.1 hypothetical protein [Aliiglaciecola sp. CAU 1673]